MAILSSQFLLFPPFRRCRPSSSSSSSSSSSLVPTLSLSNACRFGTEAQNLVVRCRLPVSASAASSSGFDVENLGDVSILSASTGEPVLFRDLWDQNEGISVVALLRHFGCICCWEFASVLRDTKSVFDSAGVKLVAVGIGTPDKACMLAERLPFPLECLYADPERKAYDVLGLYYGLGRTFFNPASAKIFSRSESFQKALKNYTVAATPDDASSVLQQGGMFVFKGKQLLYARKDEGTGDHAPLEDILNFCCKDQVA